MFIYKNPKEGKMKKTFLLLTFAVMIFTADMQAHCEIPCGIYDDSLRVKLMKEHVLTIEKSMNEALKLQEKNPSDINQLTRWIINKEEHADKIQDIATQYFLFQRIKPPKTGNDHETDKYYKELSFIHEICLYAMKTKQTLDLKNIQLLNEKITAFEKSYFLHEH